MRYEIALLVFTCLASCNGPKEEIILPGTIAYLGMSNPLSDGRDLFLYEDGVIEKTNLEKTGGAYYSTLSWFSPGSLLLIRQVVSQEERPKIVGDPKRLVRSNLLIVNEKGFVKDTLYSSDLDQLINNSFSSPSRKRIVFVLDKPRDGPEEPKTRASMIVIGEIQGEYNFKPLERIPVNGTIFLYESPWSKREDKIVYSSSSGVYIMNVSDGKRNLVSSKGSYPVWSPAGDKIAFIENNDVWIYDLANTEKSLFYRSKFAESISRLHWSPMGTYLRVQGWRYTSFGYLFEKPIDRLLIADTGNEVNFQRVGGTSYTWR